MKNFAKNRLIPFLLVAITALCALFGVILTTPNTVKADASTLPYDKELGFEVLEGENLFGKYVTISTNIGMSDSYLTIGNGDWQFSVNSEGQLALTVFSSDGGNEIINEIDYELEFSESMSVYTAILDFTKEYAFAFDCGTGEIVNIVLNEETLVVKEVFSEGDFSSFFFYPKTSYTIKTIEKGTTLAGKNLIVPYLETGEGYYWSIRLKDYSIYFDDMDAGIYFTIEDENGDPQIQEDIVLEWGGDWVYSLYNGYIGTEYFMLRIPETYSLTENGITYESTLIFDNVEVSGFENNFRVFEFIEEDTPTDTPTDTPNAPTDGENNEQDEEDKKFEIDFDKIANWFTSASEDVSNWLAEHNIEISGKSVIVVGAGVVIIASIFKRRRRR